MNKPTQRQCDFATAVTRNARGYEGLSKAEFLALIAAAWDAQDAESGRVRSSDQTAGKSDAP